MKFRNKLIKGIAISLVFTTMLTSTAFATPIDLANSAQDIKNDTLNQDAGTTYYDDELTNEWNNSTIPEEVRVKVDLASQFTITIPKEIVLDGSTGKADYVVNTKGDIAGDQVLVVEPDNEFLLSEKGGKEDIVATIVQPDTEYVYTDLQGNGTDYKGTITATLSAGEWSGRFNFNIKFNEQGLPESGQPLELYSWNEIAQISEAGLADEYFDIGDEKKVTLNTTYTASLNTLADTEEGETYTLQIIGFNHDNLANGSGKAGITFQFKEIIGTHVMNSVATNIGGWEASEMRTYINNEVYSLLPSDLQTEIKEVSKVSDAGNHDKNTLITTKDKLFILSFEEVGLTHTDIVSGQGSKYDFFLTNNRVKYLNEVSKEWWLRSTTTNNTYTGYFTYIMNYDRSNAASAKNIYGVAPAFCI